MSDKRRVLVPPSRPDLNPLAVMLARGGLDAIAFPSLRAAPPPAEDLAEALERGPECDWLVFAGGPSVHYWLEAGGRAGGARLGAIGHAAQQALRAAGLEVACAPARHTADAVAEALQGAGGLEGKTVLLLRSDRAGREIPDELGRRGARYLDRVGYTLEVQIDAIEAQAVFGGRLDAVALANPSAVRIVARAANDLGRALPPLLARALCAAAGPATAAEARRHGLAPELVVEPRDGHSLAALAAALITRLAAS